jgi:hypothetical protein
VAGNICNTYEFEDYRDVDRYRRDVLPSIQRQVAWAREAGVEIMQAAVLGARLRFRSVMMTSFAFILGLIPLVWAQGAAQISRRDIGTSVFAGMLVASTIGIFLIPMLYVVFQRLREWRPGRSPHRTVAGHFPKKQRQH